MAHTIKVPDLGEGIAQVELVAWHVQPGDDVAEDQPLADVMTDKATVEIPSPVAGRILSLGGEVGQILAVGSALIHIDASGAAASPAPNAPAPAPASNAPVPTKPPLPTATKNAAAERVPLPGSHAAPPPLASPSTSDARPIASPAVRRRAWEMGIDLRQVRPSGTAGRIMQADLDVFLAHTGHSPGGSVGTRPTPSPTIAKPPVTSSNSVTGDGKIIAVTGLRRRIAQRMQEAKRRIPHFTYVEEVDVTELEALRAQLNNRAEREHGHLTLLPFIACAMARVLQNHPGLNAHFDDEAGRIVQYPDVHLGIATQTPAGLMVPVLRHAQTLDVRAAAQEIARLAETARAGRITHAELNGSTITLTSLGALGGVVSTPIVNLPEVAIVGVNRVVERPVMRDGEILPRRMMNLSSSFDHRVIDGQDAALFIQDLRAQLEHPAAWADV